MKSVRVGKFKTGKIFQKGKTNYYSDTFRPPLKTIEKRRRKNKKPVYVELISSVNSKNLNGKQADGVLDFFIHFLFCFLKGFWS